MARIRVEEVKAVEIREANTREASVSVEYRAQGRTVATDVFITGRLWEKEGVAPRLYLVEGGGRERLGYWDVVRETYRPECPRQEFYGPIVQAAAPVLLGAIRAEQEKEDKVRARAKKEE